MVQQSRAIVVTAALALPLAVCALIVPFRGSVSTANAVLVLVLVVVAVAATGSRLAGVLAALSSTTWLDFFLLEPYLTFTIARRDDVETAVLMVLIGLAVTEIALWGRRQQARASERAGYLGGVVGAAELVAQGEATARFQLEFVGGQIARVLGIDSAAYVAGPVGNHPRLLRDGRVVRAGRELDVDRSGLPVDDVTELPVERDGVVLGRFVLTSVAKVAWTSVEQRQVAGLLADQVASVAAAGRGPTATRQGS
jgi:hypothetical protein